MQKGVYLVHFELLKKGRFNITVPKLPGCQFTAPNFVRGLNLAKRRIEAHLKALAKTGVPIPIESRTAPPLCHPVRVKLPKKTKNVSYEDLYPPASKRK